jgi:hypothetical protein
MEAHKTYPEITDTLAGYFGPMREGKVVMIEDLVSYVSMNCGVMLTATNIASALEFLKVSGIVDYCMQPIIKSGEVVAFKKVTDLHEANQLNVTPATSNEQRNDESSRQQVIAPVVAPQVQVTLESSIELNSLEDVQGTIVVIPKKTIGTGGRQAQQVRSGGQVLKGNVFREPQTLHIANIPEFTQRILMEPGFGEKDAELSRVFTLLKTNKAGLTSLELFSYLGTETESIFARSVPDAMNKKSKKVEEDEMSLTLRHEANRRISNIMFRLSLLLKDTGYDLKYDSLSKRHILVVKKGYSAPPLPVTP